MTPTHRRRRLVFLFFFIVIIRNCISTGFSSHYLLLIQTRNTDDWVFTNFIHFFFNIVYIFHHIKYLHFFYIINYTHFLFQHHTSSHSLYITQAYKISVMSCNFNSIYDFYKYQGCWFQKSTSFSNPTIQFWNIGNSRFSTFYRCMCYKWPSCDFSMTLRSYLFSINFCTNNWGTF